MGLKDTLKNMFSNVGGMYQSTYAQPKDDNAANRAGEKLGSAIKNFNKYIEKGLADVVFSNPPYMKESVVNKNIVKAISRHDKSLPINDLCRLRRFFCTSRCHT